MRTILAGLMILTAQAACAQGFAGYVYNPEPPSFPQLGGQPVAPTDFVTVGRSSGNGGLTSGRLPVSAFASGADIARLESAIAAGPDTTGLVLIAARLDRLADRFREGIALAGSINVLPPNAGDRFAVSFGGAGYDGAGAASVAVSARLSENALVYLGYARGPTQNLVKGGIGWSFR